MPVEITREQVQLIADSVPGHVAIYRYDGEHAETLYLSPSMAALNGMTWDEYEPINRANSVAMVVPEDLPDLLAAIRSHIKAKTTESFDVYFRVLHKIQASIGRTLSIVFVDTWRARLFLWPFLRMRPWKWIFIRNCSIPRTGAFMCAIGIPMKFCMQTSWDGILRRNRICPCTKRNAIPSYGAVRHCVENAG